MSDQDSILDVDSPGPCNICGEEQAVLTRMRTGSGSGISINVEEVLVCGCGERVLPTKDEAP